MATWQLSLVRSRNKGFSIIEVITAVAILGIGIWAIVALFPKGQNIIRRSGLRQLATQLAHEAISDYLAEPAKLPYAIVPFDPNLIPNRPVLLEPAYILDVRRTYNFVWGEPLDDGRPQGDPNKRVGLTPVDTDGDGQPDEWRAILRFAPALPVPNWDTNGDGQPEIRVYREVRYQRVGTPPSLSDPDFLFHFDPTQNQTVYISPTDRPNNPNNPKVLRVTYTLLNPVGPVQRIVRELYLVPERQNQFVLNSPASDVAEVVEEYPITPVSFNPSGVLTFSNPMPAPLGVIVDRLGALRVDYIIDGVDWDGDGLIGEDLPNTADDDGDGRVDEDMPGHWLVENGVTFLPDAAIQQRMNLPAGVGIFQTTFGGLSPTAISAVWLDAGSNWGIPLTISLSSDFQLGALVFLAPNNQPLPPNARVRVAYLTGDDWFSQVIKLPDDFQLVPPSGQNTNQVLQQFPYESLRWFEININQGILRFSQILAGQSVQIRWVAPNGINYEVVSSIGGDGAVRLPASIARLSAVQNASILIRMSGRTLWQQAPPRRKGDFVELISIIPPASVSMP